MSKNVDTISVPKTDESISDVINYDAIDSIYFDVASQQATLFGRAHLDYDKISIDAPTIVIDLKNNRLHAKAKVDSTGKIVEWPLLKQDQDEFQAKEISYNWQTKRGYIENVYMQEGEGYIHTNQAYLDSDKTMYVKNASYTTCNLAHPHYHFRMQKAKVIPEDKVIASMVNLYIDSIPTPLGLPFGVFPTKSGRASGILLPQYGEDNLGRNLRDFGYYWAINDSLAMKFTGEIYSKGTHGIRTEADYKIRYKYSGQASFYYRNRVQQTDEVARSSSKTFNFTWRHTTDSRKPRKLTADVKYETVNFNQLNFYQQEEFSNPQINSSVTLTLPMTGLPFSSSVSFKHAQQKGDGINTFQLPDYTINYNGERNPLKKLPYLGVKPSGFRKNILNKVAISYSTSGKNRLTTQGTSFSGFEYDVTGISENDSVDFQLTSDNLSTILKRNKFYATHSATVSLPISLKYATLSPNVRYSENWYFSNTGYDFIPELDSLGNVTDTLTQLSYTKGFNRISRYSMGASLSTSFYNFYNFGRSKVITDTLGNTRTRDRVTKIRQTISPSVTYSMSPDNSRDTDVYDFRTVGDNELQLNRYFFYSGLPSSGGLSRSITYRLDNNFELKLPDNEKRKQKRGEGKKNEAIKLMSLNLSSGYNFARENNKMSNINVTASNNSLFNGIINITSTAIFDPYEYDSTGLITDNYWAANNNFVARPRTLNIQSSIRLKPGIFKKKVNGEDTKEEENKVARNSTYESFNIPWTFNATYNYTWTRSTPTSLISRSHFTSINGSVKLSQKWSTTYNVSYNIEENEFNNPRISLNRDLHCWAMSFDWRPFGPAQGYYFRIGVNSGTLKSLKWDRRSTPLDRIIL